MTYPVNLAGFRERAKQRLPHMLFEYLDGGSYSEQTLGRNVDDLAALALRQRVMRDGSQLRTNSELFGQTMQAPIVLAPVGFSGMYARRGEVQAARAAKAASLPMCLSALSVCGIEEVAEGSGMMPWFQLYMIRDRDYMRVLLDRVRRAGCGFWSSRSISPRRARATARRARACMTSVSAAFYAEGGRGCGARAGCGRFI